MQRKNSPTAEAPIAEHRQSDLPPEWKPAVGPACPGVRTLLTAPANHNTCLEEITAGSARVLKEACALLKLKCL